MGPPDQALAMIATQSPAERGKDARFENVFRDHSDAVLGYALRRTNRPEDAADVLSEVMLVAWRRFEVMPVGEETKPWLLGVARKALANQRRSGERRTGLGNRLRDEVGQAFGHDHAQAVEARQTINDALGRLSESDREILLLASWEGLEPAEIASVMSLTPVAVRSRLHRARARMRSELAASAQEPDIEVPPAQGAQDKEQL
jgi:RNA polymerase sigma factor (sigma-70 family)